MVEQSSTVPYSKSTYKEDLNPTLGLTLLTPGLVPILFSYLFTNVRYPYTESQLLLTVITNCLVFQLHFVMKTMIMQQ